MRYFENPRRVKVKQIYWAAVVDSLNQGKSCAKSHLYPIHYTTPRLFVTAVTSGVGVKALPTELVCRRLIFSSVEVLQMFVISSIPQATPPRDDLTLFFFCGCRFQILLKTEMAEEEGMEIVNEGNVKDAMQVD